MVMDLNYVEPCFVCDTFQGHMVPGDKQSQHYQTSLVIRHCFPLSRMTTNN